MFVPHSELRLKLIERLDPLSDDDQEQGEKKWGFLRERDRPLDPTPHQES